MTRVRSRWLAIPVACAGMLGLIAPSGQAVAQGSAPERGHGLTEAEARAGCISLFDGTPTFGWTGAKAGGGRLEGGTTTTEFGDCEVRGEFDRGGTITAGGKAVVMGEGRIEIPSTGRRG